MPNDNELRALLLRHRRHVELSPGVGEDVQRYALAVLDDVLADVEALATAAPAGGEVDAWRPIETAPECGTDVLTASQSGRVSIEPPVLIRSMRAAAIADDESCWFTHWMPLPVPPALHTPKERT